MKNRELEDSIWVRVNNPVHTNSDQRGRNWLVLEIKDFILYREKKLVEALRWADNALDECKSHMEKWGHNYTVKAVDKERLEIKSTLKSLDYEGEK